MEQKDQPAPAPAPAPQPVQQWQQTPPQNVQVQYVVQQKSLDGIGGWLAFWLVVFALNGIGYASMFFSLLGSSDDSGNKVTSLIFFPILAAVYIAATVLISMRKKVGIYVSMAAIGVATVYSVINTIIESSKGYSSNVGAAIGTIVMQLMFGGLVVLYFYTSKRVKATLRDK